ncbi:Transposon Ty3-I Gag-Pol polyprotein [Thelohanellus kitauei]|uniref:Transposon Ty3-I Gag-Pol polyprotein n=1 Tax=Thelohanellus kitauei TaxID=669202 RepID=A0A0C2MT09_THEKT|nr:Transposon Ty3-I Gag-Pol polyprotein [Thelohanellus kitauei]
MVLDRRTTCIKCGKPKHNRFSECPAANAKCHFCGIVGHFKAVCIKSGMVSIRGFNSSHKQNFIEPGFGEDEEGNEHIMTLYYCGDKLKREASDNTVNLKINDMSLTKMIDSGASVSCIGSKIWKDLGNPRLQKCKDLIGYMRSTIPTMGKTNVLVTFEGTTVELTVFVTEGNDIPLLGRDWMQALDMGVQPSPFFESDHNGIKSFKASLHLSQEAVPYVHKPRIVPFSIKTKVEDELKRLFHENVLEEVNPSTMCLNWASPTVNVLKPDGSIRICGDFKTTVNKYISKAHYPLPRFDELFEKFRGGMPLDEKTQNILIISTHLGFFKYKRMPFGISSSPGIFQRFMEGVIRDIPGVSVFLDDIIISGKDVGQNLERVEMVLQRLSDRNIKTKTKKCKFIQDRVKYLGYVIDKEGIHLCKENLDAIKSLPSPTNSKELKSLLGSLNYYPFGIIALLGREIGVNVLQM